MDENAGWFADVSDEEDEHPGHPFQPFVQVAGGCFPLPIWFDNREACEDFIRHNLVGLPSIDD